MNKVVCQWRKRIGGLGVTHEKAFVKRKDFPEQIIADILPYQIKK
jgi:hypothetical protein